MNKKPCIRECINIIFNRLAVGEQFSGYDLQRWIVEINDDYKWTYIESFLREMRRHHSFEYEVVNARKSIYKKLVINKKEYICQQMLIFTAFQEDLLKMLKSNLSISLS